MFGWLRRNESKSSQQTRRSYYVPMPKHYVFNETGNIMLCATADSIHNFEEDIKDTFIDVSVFFSAMTKAVHSVINPATKRPFTIYNYQAVKNVITQSGMFIEMNVEEGVFRSKAVGAAMGKDFIQTILNRNFSESQLPFSKTMFNGMKYQEMGTENTSDPDKKQRHLCRNGTVFFICELLMGLPQTSAILVNIEPLSSNEITQDKDAQDIFHLGKMDERGYVSKGHQRSWRFKKRSYLFVPPNFIKKNIERIGAAQSQEFDELIDILTDPLKNISK